MDESTNVSGNNQSESPAVDSGHNTDGNRPTTIQSRVQSADSNVEPIIPSTQPESGIGSTIPTIPAMDESSKNSSGPITPESNPATTAPEVRKQAKRYFHKANSSKASVPPGSQEGGNSRPSFFRRLKPVHYATGAIVVLAAAAGFVTTNPSLVQAPTIGPTVTIAQPVASPSASTALPQISTVRRGSASLYPNSALTPGAVLPVTAQQVCVSGYSSTVRNVSTITKNQVFAEYNISQSARTPGAYEIDHFISLELGGSNDISNLWPEPALPVPGFHQKDQVENYLHQQVCSGKLTLTQAQREIATDWYQVYLQMTH